MIAHAQRFWTFGITDIYTVSVDLSLDQATRRIGVYRRAHLVLTLHQTGRTFTLNFHAATMLCESFVNWVGHYIDNRR